MGGDDERPAIESEAEPVRYAPGGEHHGPFVGSVAFGRDADRSSSEILHLPAMIDVAPCIGTETIEGENKRPRRSARAGGWTCTLAPRRTGSGRRALRIERPRRGLRPPPRLGRYARCSGHRGRRGQELQHDDWALDTVVQGVVGE